MADTERWHEFTFDGTKKGFTQERDVPLDDGGERFVTLSLTTFEIPGEGDASGQVYENPFVFTFRRPADGPTVLTSFGHFGVEDDTPFHTLFVPRDGQLVKVEDGQEVETLPGEIPADTWCTAAFGLLIERLQPEAGSRVSFTAIHEGNGQLQGPATLEVVEKGPVVAAVDGTKRELWRVQETINEKPGRQFWIDDDGIARVFNWGGPFSYLVADGETARAGLPTGWRTLDDFQPPKNLSW